MMHSSSRESQAQTAPAPYVASLQFYALLYNASVCVYMLATVAEGL